MNGHICRGSSPCWKSQAWIHLVNVLQPFLELWFNALHVVGTLYCCIIALAQALDWTPRSMGCLLYKPGGWLSVICPLPVSRLLKCFGLNFILAQVAAASSADNIHLVCTWACVITVKSSMKPMLDCWCIPEAVFWPRFLCWLSS